MAEQLFLFFQIFIASIIAGIVGFEREREEKPAGLKTHMIIGGASCLLVILAEVSISSFSKGFQDYIESDPIRVIQAIIVGLGFMGAGTILKNREGESIKYLTTASSILLSAGIGIGVALEQYLLAFCVAVFFFFINMFGTRIKNWLLKRNISSRNQDKE